MIPAIVGATPARAGLVPATVRAIPARAGAVRAVPGVIPAVDGESPARAGIVRGLAGGIRARTGIIPAVRGGIPTVDFGVRRNDCGRDPAMIGQQNSLIAGLPGCRVAGLQLASHMSWEVSCVELQPSLKRSADDLSTLFFRFFEIFPGLRIGIYNPHGCRQIRRGFIGISAVLGEPLCIRPACRTWRQCRI